MKFFYKQFTCCTTCYKGNNMQNVMNLDSNSLDLLIVEKKTRKQSHKDTRFNEVRQSMPTSSGAERL